MREHIKFGLICCVAAFILGGCTPDRKVSAPSSRPTQLTITFDTSSPGGRFDPRNVHAVWVEKADGTFIKTLDLWGKKRAKHLTKWAAATGDIGTEIQARTAATQKAYGTYSSQWDMKDADGNIVPDGDYMIRLELVSDNANKNKYHRASIPFKKSGLIEKIGPLEKGGYSNIVLDCRFATDTN